MIKKEFLVTGCLIRVPNSFYFLFCLYLRKFYALFCLSWWKQKKITIWTTQYHFRCRKKEHFKQWNAMFLVGVPWHIKEDISVWTYLFYWKPWAFSVNQKNFFLVDSFTFEENSLLQNRVFFFFFLTNRELCYTLFCAWYRQLSL